MFLGPENLSVLKLHLLAFDADEVVESLDDVLWLLCCEALEHLLAVVAYEFTDSAWEPRKLYLLPAFWCLFPKTFFNDNVEPDFSLIFVLCKLCDR